ncbi:amino acid ABC transporter permease [Achromobacter sp. Marseille-Q0513]|uniref:amino acid ABC transporter permease n=1 Tax=Achromobacter sp. Marseille-Q0513 TaxID=2829161 RepID=UPI001B97D6EF|nr:amino acid ABC transporter permease [Achromobacter sp. Marseille-Q0513]MBR8653809.1 amino acid ABC transporter permease [Achromobacter sp. Marseille-Q0513]
MNLADTFFNAGVLADSLGSLLAGFRLTALLGATSLVLATALGLLLVVLRLYAVKPLRWAAIALIDVLRAIPLLVLLVIVYYALPFVGLRLPPFWAATAALSLVASAYIAETFRAGIEAVPAGQVEAARALGLSWPRMMTDIVLPQAIRFTIPPGTGIAISLIKDTALASVVAMPDLLKQATQAQAYYANPTPLIGAAMLYLLLLLPLVRVVSAIENRASRRGAR